MTTYTKEQQRENRKKWVEALRSGKYKQGMHVLRDENNQMCCLGVLCTILETPHELKKFRDGNCFSYGSGALKEHKICPDEVMQKVGLKSAVGRFGDGRYDCLASLNDNGATFLEIADIIESEPEELFND